MTNEPVLYRSADEDSGRWDGFEYRADDIVISTRSKHGTTWMQMICALLVFRTSELPRPLPEISPWLDWLITPRDQVVTALDEQTHRRIIKTHTPLDGIPIDERCTYVVVARHPLDAAISLYHQSANLDRARLAELTASPEVVTTRPPLDQWIRSWIDFDGPPADRLDSLVGVMWHVGDAWSRRHDPNVILVHYDDLIADLHGQMQQLALSLRMTIDDDELRQLAHAATFTEMRRNHTRLAPDPAGVLIDREQFFRRGSSGDAIHSLPLHLVDDFGRRAAELAPTDLLSWLVRPTAGRR